MRSIVSFSAIAEHEIAIAAMQKRTRIREISPGTPIIAARRAPGECRKCGIREADPGMQRRAPLLGLDSIAGVAQTRGEPAPALRTPGNRFGEHVLVRRNR